MRLPHLAKCLHSENTVEVVNMASLNGNDNQILVEGNARVKVVILNNPQKYNVQTYQMILQLSKEFKNYERESGVSLVLVKANGRAFCVGGDIKAYYSYMTTGHWAFGAHVYKKQLTLYYLLATYRKPQVFLINGAVMGAGAGLSMNGRFRIVTENAVFAMPEVGIGLFPEVGASYFLSRLPGFFGEYLGLTGARLDGAEMLACGLATHFIFSKNLSLLEKSLYEMDTTDPIIIKEIITKYAQQAPLMKEDSAFRRLDVINKCFSKQSVEEILSCLEHEAITRKEEWITAAIKSMKMSSPINLKLFLMSIRKGRSEDLEQCLIREYRMVCHVLRATVCSDLLKGIKAKVFDKDNSPKWEPSKLELVSDVMLEKYLTKIDEDEDCEDLQLPSRTLSTTLHKAKL